MRKNKQTKAQLALDRLEYYQTKHNDFVSPFDYLLLTMNGLDKHQAELDINIKYKIDCAKEAVKYIMPRLQATELTIEEDQSLQEAKDELQELLKDDKIRALFNND